VSCAFTACGGSGGSIVCDVTRADNVSRSIVNEAAQASPVQPIVNMGQGFFGYNPPQFVLDAAHDALGKVECNQYSPTKV
jgi:aspartate/methionine/tyrosine aminotransferase